MEAKRGVTIKSTPNIRTFNPENAPEVVGRKRTLRRTKPKPCVAQRAPVPASPESSEANTLSSNERSNVTEETNSLSSSERNNESTVSGSNNESMNNGSSEASTEASTEDSEEDSFFSNNDDSFFSNTSSTNGTSIPSGPPPVGNPALPSILRIGTGNIVELYHLGKGPISTAGDANLPVLGDSKELQRLYGASSPEDLQALQLAFGVPSLTTKLTPLLKALDAKCKEDYFDRVRKTLVKRLQTLQTSLNGIPNSFQKRNKVAFSKWIEDTLGVMRGLTTPCPKAVPSAPSGVTSKAPVVTSRSVGTGPEQGNRGEPRGNGCPCLQDINILRDLIYLVALLQGTTSPEVKKQLDQIGLDDILGLVEQGNSETATVRLKEMIDMLKTVPDKVDAGSTDQDFLNQLYTLLGGELREDTPISKQDVLDLLSLAVDELDRRRDNFEALQAEKEDLEGQLAEIDATGVNKNAELKALEEDFEILETSFDTLSEAHAETIAKLQTALEQVASTLREKGVANAQVGTLKAEVEALRQQVAQISLEAFEAQANARATKNAKAREIKELQDAHSARITALEQAIEAYMAESDAKGTEHGEEVGELTGQLTALRTSLAEFEITRARIAELEAQATGFAGEKAQLEARLDEVTRELETRNAGQGELKNMAESAIARLGEQTAEWDQLKAGYEARITELNLNRKNKAIRLGKTEEELASTKVNIQKLTAETKLKSSKLEAMRANLEKCETELEKRPLQETVTTLEAELATLNAKLQALEAQGQSEMQETIEDLTRSYEEKVAAVRTAEGEKVVAKNAEIAARNRNIATLTAQLAEAKAEATGVGAKAKANANAQVKEAKNAANAQKAKNAETIKTLQTALEAEKAAKADAERKLAELPDIPPATQELLNRQQTTLERLSAELARKTATEEQVAELERKLAEKEKAESAEVAGIRARLGEVEGLLREAKVEAEKVEGLTTEIDTLKANLGAKKNKNSEEAIALKAEIAGLTRQLETARTNAEGKAELEGQVDDLAAQLEAKTQGESAELIEMRHQLEEKVQELEAEKAKAPKLTSVQARLAELDLLLEEAGQSAEGVEALQAEKVKLVGDLEYASQYFNTIKPNLKTKDAKITALEARIAELEERTPTEERLNTLLATLLLDKSLQDEAKSFMAGNDSKLGMLKQHSKQVEEYSKEMCDVYKYLYDVVNLQVIEINTTLYQGNFTEIRDDIRKIFYDTKPTDIPKEDEYPLLVELSSLFQELFVKVEANHYFRNSFELEGEYPYLTKYYLSYALGNGYTLVWNKESATLTALINELKIFNIMQEYGIIPIQDGSQSKLKLIIPNDIVSTKPGNKDPFITFAKYNGNNYTPIVIFALALIQQLKKSLDSKFTTLKAKCGL